MGQFTFIDRHCSFWIPGNDSFLFTLGCLLNIGLESIFGSCKDCGFPKPGKGGGKAIALSYSTGKGSMGK